jgi:hypothetical protein
LTLHGKQISASCCWRNFLSSRVVVDGLALQIALEAKPTARSGRTTSVQAASRRGGTDARHAGLRNGEWVHRQDDRANVHRARGSF